MVTNRECAYFIDAKPAEVLDVRANEYLCFVGAAGSPSLTGFRQYKDTKGLKKKLAKADELANLLRTGAISVSATAVTARTDGGFPQWATSELNEVRSSIGATWKRKGNAPTHFVWNGHNYDLKRALGLGTYAAVLGILGLGFGRTAQQSGCTDLLLLLDNLPGSSPEGLALIRAIRQSNKHQKEMWQNNATGLSKIGIGNLGSWSDEKGKVHPGKSHAGFTLTDWLAVGVKAAVDPANVRVDLKADSAEVSRFAAIWEAAASQGPQVKLLNLEDSDLQQAVSRSQDG